MSKEFDVEQIEGYDLMDEEEKRYFEMYGEEINSQANLVAEENGVNPEEKIKFALMMNSLSLDRSEYIVHGAPLECSMKEKSGNTQKFKYKGTVIKSTYIENEDDSKLMIQEMRAETINDKVPANVTDAKGGLRDSLRIGRNDEVEGKNKISITSFGNCKYANRYKDVREMAGRLDIELPNVSVDILEEKIKDAIMRGCGTCYCMMMLNPEWENMPLDYNWYTESFEVNFSSAGASNILSPASYQQYNGKEGINMMSMLFCRCGGIINAVKSGQDKEESIWEIDEQTLLYEFGDELAYKNWSSEKKLCAEELWKKLVEEEGIDPMFVAGLIGNIYAEGAAGMLQDGLDWKRLGLDIGRMGIISDITQAEIACGSPDEWGIGMIQWSIVDRKKILLSNYESYKSEDGTLSLGQLVAAECETIKDELCLGKEEKSDNSAYKKIYNSTYTKLIESKKNAGDKIKVSTCLLFRDYIIPGTYEEVDRSNDYKEADGVWDKALKAKKLSDVPSICKRTIAAKLAYIYFTEETE